MKTTYNCYDTGFFISRADVVYLFMYTVKSTSYSATTGKTITVAASTGAIAYA